MGTIDNIFVLHGVINHLLNENKKNVCSFYRFYKSVRLVRENMWYKLLKAGILGKIMNVIRSMYENIKSKVKYDNLLSNDFTCLLGVRQGRMFVTIFIVYVC